MTGMKVLALILIVLGVLALVYGGFSYTAEEHAAELGPLELSFKEKKRVNVPLWAGIGSIAAGTLLLVVGGSRRRSGAGPA